MPYIMVLKLEKNGKMTEMKSLVTHAGDADYAIPSSLT